jgi:PAS domain S-box-containing protein
MSNALRKQAEAKLALAPKPLAAASPAETQHLLHELRVHQIELEMQNEELRKAQAEIEAGRARYFDLYDLAPVGYVTVSEKGLVLEANLTAAALLGVNRAALVRQPLTRFILKKDQDLYYLLRNRLAEGSGGQAGQAHSLQTCELRMLKPDGSYFWAQLDATAMEGPDGAPAYRVVLNDITARKQAEEALRASQHLAESIIDSIPGAFYLLDEAGKYVRWNAYQRDAIVGKPDDQIAGFPAIDTIHPDDRALIQARIANVLRTGAVETVEGRVLLRGGPKFQWLLMTGRQLVVAGHPYLVGTGIDITDRKEHQQHVELLVRMLDEAPAAITVHDTDGRFLFANRRTLELHGYADMESFLAVNLHKLDVPESEARLAERFAAIERDGEASFEVAHYRTDGSTFPLALVARKIEWQGHSAVLSIAADISDRKRADEALREQMAELQRWHKVTLGREARVMELKREVNELLAKTGQPARYAAAGTDGNGQ